MQFIILLIVLITAIWVLIDANNIGIKKGQISGMGDMGPMGWFISCLLIWVIAFPLYIVKRNEYKKFNSGNPTKHSETMSPLLNHDLGEVEYLFQLREKGIINEEEYNAKKKELLKL